MEEKRSREMQVDNDAGGYTGWVRAKKLEVEGWVKEIDIIWFILFYYFFFRKSRRYSKMSVLFNGINFIDSMQNVIRKGLSFFNEKFLLIWIFLKFDMKYKKASFEKIKTIFENKFL